MRRVPLRTLATAVLLGIPLAACSDNAPGEQLGSSSEAINPILGCDYSSARPSPSSLTSMGYKFAARYLSGDPGGGKDISASEAKSLTDAGMDVVLVWEADGNAALSGYNQGVSDAKAAKSEADSVGQPSSRPIYFAVDFEADSGDIGSVTSYFEGVASVLGLSRTGAYGGYYTIQQLFNGNKISFGWQTYAWSDGSWDSRAQLRQTQNGVDNDQLDADQGMVADYGQWPIAAAPSGASGSCTNPDTHANELSGTCIASGEFGNLYCDNGTWNPSSCAPGAPNATSSGESGIADDVLNDLLWNAHIPNNTNHGFFKKVGSDGGYFRDSNGYWVNAQMFDAVLDGVNRTDGRYYLGLIERMSNAAEEAQGGWLEPDYNRVYFDDLSWMTLALIRAYDAMKKYDPAHAGAYLTNADNIFKAVVKFAPDQAGTSNEFEGLWWTMTPKIEPDLSVHGSISHEDTSHVLQKATASNFVPVIAAARFAERLEKSEADFYASWAKTVYQYWRAEAVLTENDGSLFVRDSIQGGKWETEYFTYNQGVGIGAALELARLTATSDPTESAQYLADAHRMADFLVNHETINVSGLGPVLSDGGTKPSSGVSSHGTGSAVDSFKGIAYRYLTELYTYDTGLPAAQRSSQYTIYEKVLQASYQAILTLARDTKIHEIGFRWDLPVSKQQQATFVSQGSNVSAVMAVELFAQTFPGGT